MSQQVTEKPSETAKPAEGAARRKRPASHRGFGWTLIHAFGSLKLAMLLFIVIIGASILGTIEESRFDARVAQDKIYHATWFTFWLALLCINLAAATLTRWPWRKRHTGFIITHAGIILLLIGSIIGKHFGIEGSMTLRVGGQPEHQLFLSEMALHFWDSSSGEVYRAAFPVDLNPPSEERPRYFPLPGHHARTAGAPFARLGTRFLNRAPKEPTFVFDQYSEKLVEHELMITSPGSGDPAVQLEMRSEMMGDDPVMVQLFAEPGDKSYHNLADLAQISLASEIVRSFDQMESPSPLLQVRPVDEETVEYHVINSRGEVKEGVLAIGEALETGWADWTVKLRKVVPEARLEKLVYEDKHEHGGRGLTGVRGWLDWGDGRKTEPEWYLAGDMHRVELDGELVRFAFGYRREALPFKVDLLRFEVPRDEGTDTPANFTSHLRFTDPQTGATVEDSCGMNVPAIFPVGFHRLVTGFTYKFSQASWNPEDLSESTVQVLRDPGWLLKWIGSLTIVCGIYTIFFLRPYRNRRPEDIIDAPEKSRADSAKSS